VILAAFFPAVLYKNSKICKFIPNRPASAKGSPKNKFTFFSVEAPVWQGGKAMIYQNIASFRNAARRDASALENVKLFLRKL
jgi:hypothetical protein